MTRIAGQHDDLAGTDSTSLNSCIDEIETLIAELVGTRHAILCSSGRNALRLSLLALGIGQNNEVIVPDLVCPTVPITVFCTGATPVFCDIDRETLTLSPERLSEVAKSNTKAVIFAPLYGIPVDPTPIREIAQEMEITLIEDAAQMLGASINGRKSGSMGDVGILSFNKFLNVNLGGAATTNDDGLAARIRLIRSRSNGRSLFAWLSCHLMESTRLMSWKAMRIAFVCEKLIHNLTRNVSAQTRYRPANILTRIDPKVLSTWRSGRLPAGVMNQLMETESKGYCHSRRLEKLEVLFLKRELSNLEGYLEKRRRIARIYQDNLEEGNLMKACIKASSVPSYMRYPVVFSYTRELLNCVEGLAQNGFTVNFRYRPLHLSSFSKLTNNNSCFDESDYLSDHMLPLPLSHDMGTEEAEKVVSTIKSNMRV